MEILRAIRAFDKDADVILAELSYAIVTYNGSILEKSDSEVSSDFSVSEITPVKAISQVKADKTAFTRIYEKVSLSASNRL